MDRSLWQNDGLAREPKISLTVLELEAGKLYCMCMDHRELAALLVHFSPVSCIISVGCVCYSNAWNKLVPYITLACRISRF